MVKNFRSGLLVIVMQPLASSLGRLNDFLERYDIFGVNLILDEADTLWTHKAGVGVQPSYSERERCLYSLMGPFAKKGHDEIPLLNSRLRTIIAVSRIAYYVAFLSVFKSFDRVLEALTEI